MTEERPYRELPGGGMYVTTSAGPVQFGIPPETIKDSLSLGLDVPSTFVVIGELFDRERSVNVAEVEFPSYFNFFILGRQTRILVEDASVEARLRAVFQETLLGPEAPVHEAEFAPDYPEARRPDFKKEGEYFRTISGKRLVIDDLISFVRMSEQEDGFDMGNGVVVEQRPGGRYGVVENGVELALSPPTTPLPDVPEPAPPRGERFSPPDFGVTVLGSSHGFDPGGKTTGFILWVGRRGLLVDPPADTTEYLREHNVPPKIIDGVIVTHCHADHDCGAFQKILEEGRIKVFTTPRIMGSFLRKYSALSGVPADILRRTFQFVPAVIGEPIMFSGGEITFFYTFHSIPNVGTGCGQKASKTSIPIHGPQPVDVPRNDAHRRETYSTNLAP